MQQAGNAESSLARELAGKRVTSQRRLLLDLILKARAHLDADELYRQAREREPSISLSTVYRNLRLFKELDLIEERHFADEHHRYEAKPETEHHHLVCLGCGEVIEFECPVAARMKRQVARDKRFVVTSAEVYMTGYCARCQQGMARGKAR